MSLSVPSFYSFYYSPFYTYLSSVSCFSFCSSSFLSFVFLCFSVPACLFFLFLSVPLLCCSWFCYCLSVLFSCIPAPPILQSGIRLAFCFCFLRLHLCFSCSCFYFLSSVSSAVYLHKIRGTPTACSAQWLSHRLQFRCLIPDRNKRLIFSPKLSHRFWTPTNIIFCG